MRRSAGAEQIVAMSLIEALNFNGRRVGPMIMDTPVGRLDKIHRSNILNYLPKVVTQLALFSHSGEIEDNSEFIKKGMVGRKYRINRETSFRSKIEEVVNAGGTT